MKTLKISILTFTFALLGASALQAMEKQKEQSEKLSTRDEEALNLVESKCAKMFKNFNEARVIIQCLSPEGLELIEKKNPLLHKRILAILGNDGISVMSEIIQINIEEKKALQEEMRQPLCNGKGGIFFGQRNNGFARN